jgi:hypothetical protein
MTEIIQAIDTQTLTFLSGYSGYTNKLFGFCELVKFGAKGQDQPIPATIPDREKVSLNDAYKVITWIRQTDVVQYEDNPDFSYGTKEARFANLPLRLIFCNKVELGENLVYDFVEFLPSKISVSGYKLVFIKPELPVNPDHETIYLTELGNTVYERHRIPWNVYAITLNIQYMKCE